MAMTRNVTAGKRRRRVSALRDQAGRSCRCVVQRNFKRSSRRVQLSAIDFHAVGVMRRRCTVRRKIESEERTWMS